MSVIKSAGRNAGNAAYRSVYLSPSASRRRSGSLHEFGGVGAGGLVASADMSFGNRMRTRSGSVHVYVGGGLRWVYLSVFLLSSIN